MTTPRRPILDSTASGARVASLPQRPSQARLSVVHPAQMAATIPLGAARTVLGRAGVDESPPVAHETVSRSHLAIDWDGSARAHAVTDLGSHNGSWVDGARVGTSPVVLADGSVVRLGDVLLVFEGAKAPGGPEPAEVSQEAIPGRAVSTGLLRRAVLRAARDPAPALLVGETGTGKEWIAAELHRLSARRGKMLALNCAALSPHLVESQLFGHVRGAFTGADEDQPGLFRAADRGTLFLDEIGELPLELQPKILRVLQEGEVHPVGSTRTVRVDVRVVAATNRDLHVAVEAGTFRRDLYARLALWEIRVPSLRDRRTDLFEWIERLARRWWSQRGSEGSLPSFDCDAAEALLLHAWPDNLRGLDRLVHELGAASARAVARAELPPWLLEVSSDDTGKAPGDDPPISARLPAPSREEFVALFERLGGNVRAVARHLGRDRRQVYRWMEAHGIRKK